MAVIEKFLLVGTQAGYDALESKSADKLYFCSDTRNIYKGEELYTDGVRAVSARPTTPATGVFYYITSASGTKTLEFYDGAAWHVAVPTIMTTVDAASTDDQLATAKAVYDFVMEQLETFATSDNVVSKVEKGSTAGTISITKGTSEDAQAETVVVPGVVVSPTYDAEKREIKLPVSDGETLVITLGKDIFIDSTKDNKYNAETGNIELYLNDGTSIVIPVADLVDVYTGVESSTAKISVSDTNQIQVTVKLSTKEGNALVIDEETEGGQGLYLDLSPYMRTATYEADKQTIDQNITNLQQAVQDLDDAVDKLNGDATTEGSVAYQIAAAAKTINENATAIATKVTALEDAFGFGTF